VAPQVRVIVEVRQGAVNQVDKVFAIAHLASAPTIRRALLECRQHNTRSDARPASVYDIKGPPDVR
jgi:hypothetical protein